MTLKEIFSNKDFVKFRESKLDESDKEYFLDRLKNGNGIYDVLPYLDVVKKAPIEFLEPLVEQAMEYEDISAPKRWMQTINRLYTPEKIQETILNKITSNRNLRTKCRAAAILYCVGGFVSMSGRDSDGKIKWNGEIDYEWNGERFETIYLAKNLSHGLERKKNFYTQRIRVLSNEFIETDNIIFKYFLKRYLPRKIEEYPIEIRETAKKVINEVYSDNFPSWVNPLIERVKGNTELEKLLFEDLNWRQK